MRILFITQRIDQNDAVLGFVHGWLRAFSGKFEKILAICLEKGKYELPENVAVFSLGKENTELGIRNYELWRKFVYIWRFYKNIWRARREYDVVFVHMNPEYVILGAPIWQVLGKRVVLWYNHTFGDWRAKFAFLLADKICHTSPYAFSAGRTKSVRMPAGIDTDVFKPVIAVAKGWNKIVFLGRISPLKDLGTLIKAVEILHEKSMDFILEIFGDAPKRDEEYFEKIQRAAAALVQSGHISFKGGIPNREAPRIFSAVATNVNLTPRGNYDKTVLEAMACGTISLVSSPAFKGVVPDEFTFKEKEPLDLAKRIEYVLSLSGSEREKIGYKLRQVVIEKEGLILLTQELFSLFSSLQVPMFQPGPRPLRASGLRSYEANPVRSPMTGSSVDAWRRTSNRANEACLRHGRGGQAMKLYYVANTRLPNEKAHGIQIAKMCEAFLEVGADLTVLAPDRGESKSMKEFYNLRREIPIIRLPILPIWIFGEFWYRLSALSFAKVALIYLWWQKILGVKARVHLIDMDQVSLSVAPLSPFPVTLEIHDAKPKTPWFSWIFGSVALVLTINNIIKKKIIERFDLPDGKVLVFPNGIDLELFRRKFSKEEAREKLGLTREGKFVMYTGQFYAWKGLEIFPEVAKLMPEVSFYLVGGTKEEFEKVTKIFDLPKNLIFAGKRPFTEIPIWLNSADAAVVLGTKRDEYSFYHTSPMKLFEYMAAEVPIIAAKTPAIIDAVSDVEVFFYEPDSVSSLVETIKEALGGVTDVKQKTTNALEKAQNLSWKNRAHITL